MTAQNIRFIGLDGEMSGADRETGHALIQAGIAIRTDTGDLHMTRHLLNTNHRQAWDRKAERIHGIREHDAINAPAAADVDNLLHNWLLEHGATPDRRELIAVGFNVGAFDLPFFRDALPRTMSLISRRSGDLNSLCFALAGWDPRPNTPHPRGWEGWKRSAKKAAAHQIRTLGITGAAHDAGYDAAEALLAHEWLLHHIHTSQLPAPDTSDLPAGAVTILGARLTRRLHTAGIDTATVTRLADAYSTGQPVIGAGAWFAAPHRLLNGRTPLEAVIAGAVDAVITVLTHSDTQA